MQNSKFKIIPAYYSSRLDYPGGKRYTKYPGIAPKGECSTFNNETACEAHTKELGCSWIEDYLGGYACRSPYGSVSKQIFAPFAQRSSAIPVSEYQLGNSKCLRVNENTCKDEEHANKCHWIKDKNGTSYCSGNPYTSVPFSTQFKSNLAANNAFQPSGRFNPHRYSKEEKESWFPKVENEFDIVDQKYCRCILKSAASNIYRTGQQTVNPYAICGKVIPSKYASSVQNIGQVASNLVTKGRAGGCTKYASFENFPTELLYAFAKTRQTTAKGSRYFGNIPNINEFLNDMEKFRPYLLNQANAYKNIPKYQNT